MHGLYNGESSHQFSDAFDHTNTESTAFSTPTIPTCLEESSLMQLRSLAFGKSADQGDRRQIKPGPVHHAEDHLPITATSPPNKTCKASQEAHLHA
jgi:hypothetical protein